MRSITFCFFFIFLITSCEREDLLEGVSITPSIYEDPYLCCVSVRDVRQVSCDRIGFYVDVDLDSDTHYAVKSGILEGDSIVTGSYKAISRELQHGTLVTVDDEYFFDESGEE